MVVVQRFKRNKLLTWLALHMRQGARVSVTGEQNIRTRRGQLNDLLSRLAYDIFLHFIVINFCHPRRGVLEKPTVTVSSVFRVTSFTTVFRKMCSAA